MKKYIIRKRESDDNMFESLTESEIRRIVREVLNEGLNDMEPVPGFVNVNRLKIEDIEKVYSLCKKAYECIRDFIKITGQENDPYLKYALSGINGFGNSVRMELDYEKRGNNQVHYKY